MKWIASRLLVCVALAAAVACSDDESTEQSVSVSDAAPSDGDSGTDDDGGAEPYFMRSGYHRFCGLWAFGTCTEALLQPLQECLNEVCRPSYEACRRTCGEYLRCVDTCDCANRTCISLCELSSDCLECIAGDRCVRRHDCAPLIPACYTEPIEYSCAELEPCCEALAGSEWEAECDELVASGGDDCTAHYLNFCDLTQSSD